MEVGEVMVVVGEGGDIHALCTVALWTGAVHDSADAAVHVQLQVVGDDGHDFAVVSGVDEFAAGHGGELGDVGLGGVVGVVGLFLVGHFWMG